jgi:hypothetical protein
VAKRRNSGGFVPKNQESKDRGLAGTVYHQQGKGYASGGSVRGGAGSGPGRLRNSRIAAKVPAKTEL